jgi:hypothetical protein
MLLGVGWGARAAPRSVTIVGIDGGAWRVIDPLLARGDLPNLARLIAAVCADRCAPSCPHLPPGWTSIATRSPATPRHPRLQRTWRIVMSLDRRVPRSGRWPRRGLRTAVIGWWATYPRSRSTASACRSARSSCARRTWATLGDRRGDAKLGNLVYPPDLLPKLEDILAAPSPGEAHSPWPRACGPRTRAWPVPCCAWADDGTLRPRARADARRGRLLHNWRFPVARRARVRGQERPTAAELAAYGA